MEVNKIMEYVMTVKTELLKPLIKKDGLTTESLPEIENIVDKNHTYMPRPEAEKDPDYKQPIPYIVIRRGARVFMTRRLSKGTETRLHGLASLGIGGHINPCDDTPAEKPFLAGLYRELDEEVYMEDKSGDMTLMGVINNDSTDVGTVHVGFFYLLDTKGDVSIRETEKLTGEWVEISKLNELAPEMEGWSQIIVPYIGEK